jgi:nitrogen-specific signal transduction histidine kinase
LLKATFSGVSDSLSVPHFLLTLDGTIVLANKAAKATFSNPHIQIEGLNIQDIVSDSPEKLKGILRIWSGNQSPMLSKLSFKMKDNADKQFLCKGCTMRILNHKPSAFLLLQCQDKNKSISVFLALNKRIEQLEHEKSLQFNEKEKVDRLNKELELRVKERTEELEKAYSNLSKSLVEFKQAQEQLVRTERLASLGSLVASVAHEISTPIGVCVTAASHLEQHVGKFKQHYSQGKLTRTDFESYLNTSSESSSIINYNLKRAADVNLHPNGATHLRLMEPPKYALFTPQTS